MKNLLWVSNRGIKFNLGTVFLVCFFILVLFESSVFFSVPINFFFSGKHPTLGFDNEKRLVAHIQKLEKAGFPTTRQDVRKLAFEFAEKLGLENSFNNEKRMAGQHWLK